MSFSCMFTQIHMFESHRLVLDDAHCVCVCLDGELYTGTVADYMGNRPVISRHLSEGGHVDLKLDDTLGWLEGTCL